MDGQELELYIHIPFCVKKCAYCDFLSFAADETVQDRYVSALCRELEFYGEKYKNRTITTIFIGGGTPSWLHEDKTEQIMQTVRRVFPVEKDAEVTIECNPGTVTDQKLRTYKRIGINRLSIGLQSVHNEELKLLGRIHTYEQFLKTFEMARKQGFSNINIDLMSSLPGQTPETFEDSLRRVLMLKPEHISAYSLIIEEGTPFYERYREDALRQEAGIQTKFLPTEEEEYATTKLTQRILKDAGYHWYEISNFAKPGFECRHNIGYWKRADYLGTGLGAASLIQNVRYANTGDLDQYMKGCEKIYACTEKQPVFSVNLHETAEPVSRREQMEEFMFLGLRMCEGISREEFRQAFGTEIEAAYAQALHSLQEEGLLLQKEGRICLTEKGMDLNNYAAAQFV